MTTFHEPLTRIWTTLKTARATAAQDPINTIQPVPGQPWNLGLKRWKILASLLTVLLAMYGGLALFGITPNPSAPIGWGRSARMERQIRAALETYQPSMTEWVTPHVRLAGHHAEITLTVNQTLIEGAVRMHLKKHGSFLPGWAEMNAWTIVQGHLMMARELSAQVAQRAEYIPRVTMKTQ